MTDQLQMLREAIGDAGYALGRNAEDRSFLAESPERVVWNTVFATAEDLLDSWQNVQAEAIEQTQALSPEKAWELYLVLATELDPPIESEGDLELVRRDTSYARKIVVPGLENLTSIQLAEYLSPLRALEIKTAVARPDALSRLSRLVTDTGEADVIAVVRAFEANRPLFGDL